MDAEGQHCQQLYSTTWPSGVTAIAGDWHNVYWVTKLGELFSKVIDESRENRLDDFKLSNIDPCTEAPDFTNVSRIATYGPEQWTPTVPVECFDLHIEELELDFESEEITVKIQWNMEGSCANISRSPIKIKIEFYRTGCDGEACETKMELGSSFQMTRTIDLPSLKPASQYVVSTSVATPGLMQMWLNPLLTRDLPCDATAYCFSKTRRDLYKTPEAPINLEETWIITAGLIGASAILVAIILAVVWYIRKQQWFIYRKLKSPPPLQIKEIHVIDNIGEGKGRAGKVYKVEVIQEDGRKMEAAMKVAKGTDNARRMAYESFVLQSTPPHKNICGHRGIAFSSITQIIDKRPCIDRAQSDEEQQPGTSGYSASTSASSRSTGSKFEIELPYGTGYFVKQLAKDTNSQEVLCQMMLYLSTNMADTSTTIRYRPLNDNTTICESADPNPKHRLQLATLTKKHGSITLSTQVDSSMFDEQSDEFGKEVLVLELCDGSLDKYIIQHRGELTFGQLLDIVIQVAQGAVHLQENSVRHNDLTLDNVLYIIEDHGAITCKIGDFGEAKLLPKNAKYYGAASRPFPWMFAPPEMFRKKEISGFTEVWFLTYSIYQVFTYGKRPWDLGSHPAVADMREIHDNQTPPEIPQRWPQRLQNIIKTGLEVDKGKRYTDVSQVLQELKLLESGVSQSYSKEKWPAVDQSVSDATQNDSSMPSTDPEQSNSQSEESISKKSSLQTIPSIDQQSQGTTSERSFSAKDSQTGEIKSAVTIIAVDDAATSSDKSCSDDSESDLEEQTAKSDELPPNIPYVT